MKEAQTRFTTEALVIKEMNVGESDRLVTLFTRDYGVLKAFAAGAKNLNSKKGSATSLLTYGSFTIFKKKDTYKIYEAVPIRLFFHTGMDVSVLALSQYLCELSLNFAPAGEPNAEFLRLILNSLYFLTVENRKPDLIKAITELRIAAISGYMPDLVACKGCGKYEDDLMYMSLHDGCLFCGNCRPEIPLTAIDRTVLSAMRHIVYSEFRNLYAFQIPDAVAGVLSELTGRYLTLQSDHSFSTLQFYNACRVL